MKLLLLIKSIIVMRKLYYSISEVCQLVDEEQHILRYWEKEFPQLKPKKNRGGNRIYSEKDVFLINSIKKLLRDEKISLKNAKEKLSEIGIKSFEDNLFSNKLEERTLLTQGYADNKETTKDIEKGKITLSKTESEEILNILRNFSKILNRIG
ncbi:MAG: MerR family transcriptional regulator [bacterium]